MMDEPRFFVTTTTGFPGAEPGGKRTVPGVTAMVLDRGNLHSEVWVGRSEDMPTLAHTTRPKQVRDRAARVAAALNAGKSHRIPTSGAEHGTYARYHTNGCRCARCRKAAARYYARKR